jgi:EAL domain-containing protein (putative c-di-GMP-specific phosphodiesterase class I)
LIERIAIESSLRRAIDRGEFRVLYQPVVSVARRRIVSMEALLRWQHPHRGLLEPSQFIDVAENTGQMVQIGEWVIEQAARQAAAWATAAPDAEPVRVSVNLSPRQVLSGDIVAIVARVLGETGLEPSLLEFEITETMLFDGADACVRTLRELKGLGVRLVLDDFGTGYASFGYLTRLAIDALKLDRTFVGRVSRDDDDGAIVSAVLSMARALDVEVTAEGVETRAQLSRLRGHGCEFAQGYLFSPPVTGEQAAVLLKLARPGATAERATSP